MAIIQKGFLGNKGPVFVDDSTVSGKVIVLQGGVVNGVMRMQAVQPAYAGNLTGFPYAPSDCTLGPYSDLQDVGPAPAYTQPSPLPSGYANKQDSWTTPSGTTGLGNTTTSTGSTSTGSTSTGSTSTGSTSTGSMTTGTTIFSASDATTTVETFLSKYWYIVLLIAVALLWKPVIAPALGIKQSRRRR